MTKPLPSSSQSREDNFNHYPKVKSLLSAAGMTLTLCAEQSEALLIR